MPLQKIQLRPGINRESTTYSNEGGYYAGDKVRFRSGFPEAIGGWSRLSASTFLGVCRAMINWVTLAGENYLGLGTNLKYYVEKGGTYNDITPIVKTSVYTNPITTGYSTLNGGITATDTSLTLVSSTSFAPSGVILIGTEQILYTLVTGNVLSGLTRGYNGTTAAIHATSAPVGSATILFADTDNDANNNDFVIFSGASAVGGISAGALNTEHQVTKVGAGVYAVTVTDFATSQVTGGGGTVTVQYEVPAGLATETSGVGWGAGTWGRGTWGSAASVGISQQLRLWTHDNFGEDLIFAPRGSAIYYFKASTGVGVRGVTLSSLATAAGYSGANVPLATNQVLTSGVSRFVITLGSNSYNPSNPNTAFDPLLVRWSDQENPYQWVPLATNQSGEQRLSNGSYIMCGRLTRQEILIWTDSALFSMQYLGPPYVFGINLLMDNISIASPNAAITVNNVTYWMGTDKFYSYSGRVETLPCTLRQYIFGNFNKDQAFQVFAGTNEGYNEIWWFYCSAGSNTVDSYVIYNHLERVWTYGSMSRTAWLDSPLRSYPMAADANNRILFHESTVDDESGDTAVPIHSFIESSDFDIGDGHNFGFVWRIIPDLTFDGSTAPAGVPPQVTMSVLPRRFPGSNYGAVDTPTVTRIATYPVEQFTGQVYTRMRGRQMALRIEANRLGTRWQLGSPRLDVRPDGRR